MSAIVSCVLFAYAVPFLTYYPGAQQSAMAGAFVAIADDAYANFYNPAGLGFQRRPSLAFERNSVPWQAHTYHGDVSVVAPVWRRSAVGAFYNQRRHNRVTWLEVTNQTDEAAGITYGHALWQYMCVGIGLKYIHSTDYYSSEQSAYNRADSGGTFAWDAGMLWQYPASVEKYRLGIALQTIPTGVKIQQGVENLPTNLRLGASYIVTVPEILTPDGENLFRFGNGKFGQYLLSRWRLALAYDLNLVFAERYRDGMWYGDTVPEKLWHSLGVELRPLPFFAVRFGYFEDMTNRDWHYDYRRGWTLGMGLDFKYFRLDIADDQAMSYGSYAGAPFRIRFTLSGSL